jgi:hypothetical protein
MSSRSILRMGFIAVALCLAGCFGGAHRDSYNRGQAELYAHQLHDRFYERWIPPESVPGQHGKVSVPVDVRIDQSGRLVDFNIVQLSGRPAIDKSVAAVATTVPRVHPPPFHLHGRYYELRIYFELDVK